MHPFYSETVVLRCIYNITVHTNISCSRSLYVIVRPSVVCNICAPYSGD